MTQSRFSTAGKVLNCLKGRHINDLFVPECKTGPTMYAPKGEKPPRMDAYVIKGNWDFNYIGYEIKSILNLRRLKLIKRAISADIGITLSSSMIFPIVKTKVFSKWFRENMIRR